MICPSCQRETRPSRAMRRNAKHRNWKGNESLPTAAKLDGTCTRCDDHARKYRFGPDYQPTEAEIVERGRQEVAAYFADRRARGVDPDGNRDLDKMFEDDVKTGAWQLPRNLARRSHAAQRIQLGLPAKRGA